MSSEKDGSVFTGIANIVLRGINAGPSCPWRTACGATDAVCHHGSPGAMSPNASAQDLAEDLRRFQAGEPIHARRVGRVERGWRWCRRTSHCRPRCDGGRRVASRDGCFGVLRTPGRRKRAAGRCQGGRGRDEPVRGPHERPCECLLLCSRQSGKSTVAAALALRTAFFEAPAVDSAHVSSIAAIGRTFSRQGRATVQRPRACQSVPSSSPR